MVESTESRDRNRKAAVSIVSSVLVSLLLEPLEAKKIRKQRGVNGGNEAWKQREGRLGAKALSMGATALNYGIFRWSYDKMQEKISSFNFVRTEHGKLTNAVSSAIASAFTSFFTHPIYNVRSLYVLESTAKRKPSPLPAGGERGERLPAPLPVVSVPSIVRKMMAEGGLRSFYRGFDSALFAIPNTVLLMLFYERKKPSKSLEQRELAREGNSRDKQPRSLWKLAVERSFRAFTGKLLATVVSFPLASARLYQQKPPKGTPIKNTLAGLRYIVAKRGFFGLYRGMFTHMQRTLLHTPLFFVSYEFLLEKWAQLDRTRSLAQSENQ